MTTHEAAAVRRATEVRAPADRPSQRRMTDDPSSRSAVRVQLDVQEMREETRNGLTVVRVGGHASVTETPYEMHDLFGPYNETVSRGSFGKTLASSPMVEFTLNHGAGGGLPMAHARNDTLTLAEDEIGLRYDAYVDPQRSDVKDMLRALERGDLAEASFKFRIDSGMWSPDFTEYRIDAVDLHRGDVSAVNFGANPAATSALRAQVSPVAPSRLLRAKLALALAG
jgi:HK97 family phage prohead protease